MKKNRVIIGFLICVLALARAAIAQPDQEQSTPLEITFVATSYTGPAKGPDPRKPAIIDHAISLLNGKISPTYILTSVSRGWQLLKDSPNVCVAEKLRLPEREELGYFTKRPPHIYPPHRLQTNRDTAKKLVNYTSLEEILRNTDIVIGIAKTINYGDKIMPLIKQYPDNFYALSNVNDHEEMLDTMTVAGRIDANFRASHNEWPNQKKLVPIAFSESNTVLKGYLLCSMTETGKKTVGILNQIMATEAYRKFMLQAHLKAFPESEHDFLQEHIDLIFKD